MLKKALQNAPPARDFMEALRAAHLRTGLPGLVAEVEIAQANENGGAACLSVLTDEKYFKGSFENLEAIRRAGVKLSSNACQFCSPLLCKEFIKDAWQIYYARTKGADAVLLIAAVFPHLDIRYMIKVHDETELDLVLGIEGIKLIGTIVTLVLVGVSIVKQSDPAEGIAGLFDIVKFGSAVHAGLILSGFPFLL
ncbi:hypothetical protein Patl1_05489 [Pistacia atlantica]|uniref:Uncharacterized protein n=1 Tax=Pistacia atlantica TaxID=434234 RepID=A0ACC1BR61_9ROSI|nr:hypothetical protein Patl1_05489 [Pistacia atlantica]